MRVELLTVRCRNGLLKAFGGSIQFFQGIIENDVEKIEIGLNDILKRWQKHQPFIIRDYMNIEATGFAKLAWRIGIHVESRYSLIPKNILPVKPAKEYLAYDFFAGKQPF